MLDLLIKTPIPVVYGFWLRTFAAYGQTYFIALFGLSAQTLFALDSFTFGAIYSAATLAASLVMMIYGPATDRISIRALGWIGIGGLILTCFTLSIANHWIWFGLGLFGLRLFSIGILIHTAVLYLSHKFNRSRGRALSLSALGHTLGEAMFPWIVIYLLTTVGATGTWIWLGAIVVIFLALPQAAMHKSLDKTMLPSEGHDSELRPLPTKIEWDRGMVYRDSEFWLMLPGTLAPALVLTGVFFHIKTLYLGAGLQISDIAYGMSCFALARFLSALAIGPLIDRFTALTLLPGSLIPLWLGFLIVSIHINSYSITAFMAFSGVTVGISSSLVPALLAEVYGLKSLGSVRSLSSSIAVFATSIMPVSMGYLIYKGISMQVLVCACLLYTTLAICLNFRSRQGFRMRTNAA